MMSLISRQCHQISLVIDPLDPRLYSAGIDTTTEEREQICLFCKWTLAKEEEESRALNSKL